MEKHRDYPTNQILLERYKQAEQSAIDAIKEGRVKANPNFTYPSPLKDYSICAQGHIFGTPAHTILVKAMGTIKKAEPNLRLQPEGFLHFTLQEVAYHREGRKHTQVNAIAAMSYHQALNQYLPDYEPINLALQRIFPTLDPSENEFHTASLVASFLAEDHTVFKLREDIKKTVEKAELPFNSRLGTIKVLFVTLGRFVEPPTLIERNYPLLDALEYVNKLPKNIKATIDRVQLISTATSYPFSDGHVFIEPEINLARNLRPHQFLTPEQKSRSLIT